MKKQVLLALFNILYFNCLGSFCWVQKSSVGTIDRYAAMGFSINGKGYVGCGFANGTGQNDFWEYDTLANSWTQKATYPGGQIWAGAGFSISNKGYFTVGTTGTIYSTDTYEYDPITNAWTMKAPFPATGRQDCYGFSINNLGYVTGGWRSGNYYNTTYQYDPVANLWIQKASIPAAGRSGIRGFTIGNIAYIFGGLLSGAMVVNDLFAYDGISNSWTLKAPRPGTARHSVCAFEMNGKGYVGNGDNLTSFVNDFREYNPLTNTWSPVPNFPGLPKGYPVCFTIGNTGFIATGKSTTSINSNQTWILVQGPEASFVINNNNCLNYSFSNTSTNGTSFQWDFGDGTTSNQSSPSHSYPTTGNYTVTLIASNGTCSDTITQTINVSSNLSAGFTVTVINCTNTINITNNSTNATNYTWQWGNGQQSNGPQTNYTYPNAGNYIITLIAINGSCSDTTTQNINIPQSPTANFNFSYDCNNNLFINNFISNASQFTWHWGDGQQTIGNAISHTYSNAGIYTLSLVISDGNCIDTLNHTITIPNAPISAFTATANCNQGININNNSQYSTNYIWNWGNGQQSTGDTSAYAYMAPGTYTILLIAENGLCSDSSFQSITVDPPVQAQFSATPDCNQGITLSNNSIHATNFNWNWGDGSSSSMNPAYHQYQYSGNYLVTLIAGNGICEDTIYQSIAVDTFPISSILYNFNQCHDTVYFDSQNSSLSYFWNFDNGSTAIQSTAIQAFPTPGSYTISLINSNNLCSDTATVNINSNGTVHADLTYDLSCDGILTTLNSTNNVWQYDWDFGDGTSSTTSNPIHQYINPGSYVVTLTVDNGYCTANDTTTLNYLLPTLYEIMTKVDTCTKTVSFSFNPPTSHIVLWEFGDGSNSNSTTPSHTYDFQHEYYCQLIVNPAGQCPDTAFLTLNFTQFPESIKAYTPNSFTPNNDSKNDTYQLSNTLCKFEEVLIYNRWGQRVFHSNDPKFSWDGTTNGHPQPDGIYLLCIKANGYMHNTSITVLR